MNDPAIPKRRRSLTRRVLGGSFAALSLLLTVPTAVLVIVAETRAGRLMGGVAAALVAACVCSVLAGWRAPAESPRWRVAVGMALAIAGFLAFVLVKEGPTDRPERSSGLLSRSFGGRRVPRASPASLLPEIDQVKLGLTFATRFVPWSARARTIREVTMGLYREIEADPDARGLAPVTHFGALELVGADFEASHYFAYVPRARPGERLGAIVFLHGNGGNFQVVPWAWRSFAEKHRVVILCPTFGFGFWGEGGVEAVDRVWVDARDRWPIDESRVYLAGLSDGGVGVTRSGLAHPDRYRGLIYISPTMKLEELSRPEFLEGWRGRPILVFQGDRDWNVSKASVDLAVDLLKDRGVAVDYRVFSGEDHFLFFSRRFELFDAIGARMAEADRILSTVEKAGGQR